MMATVAALPFAKVPKGYNKESRERSSKNAKAPTRSMTHPIHDPAKASKPRRVKNGEPFDPEELTRRLTVYLAEQKAASQRRREARAAKERAAAIAAGIPVSATDAVYHHIPTFAAAAFQRTATPNIVTADTVHKLAAPVLKAALQPSNADDSFQNHGSATLGRERSVKMTALQRALRHDAEEMEKERLRNRNQFQRTRDIEEAAEVDEMRDVYRAPQRTFGEFAHLRHPGRGHSRPLSTGDVFSDSEDTDGIERFRVGSRKKLEIKTKGPGLDYGGRNDWAQEEAVKSPKSPEAEGGKGRTVKERVSGLRRKESIWVLMGKKEKTKAEDGAGNGGGVGVEECTSPPPMDGKKGFLARFKRHPS